MTFLRTAVIVVITAVGVKIGPLLVQKRPPHHFGGFVDEKYKNVENVFRENFEYGWEPEGAALAVFKDGKLMVDLWGGYADRDSGNIWKEDTMTVCFSSTKAVAALAVAMAVDRGYLSYDELVVKYWPEFGKHGKDNVTVAMLASHQSGVMGTDEPMTAESLKDHKKLGGILANTKPQFPPGDGRGYHALTFGPLMDQLISRVDPQHRNLSTFVREELLIPNGIKDWDIGAAMHEWYRVARYRQADLWQIFNALGDAGYRKTFLSFSIKPFFSTSLISKVLRSFPLWTDNPNLFNNPEVGGKLEIYSANGIGTARALAKMFSLVAEGKIISPKLLDKISKPIHEDVVDRLIGVPISAGWGFMFTKSPKGNWILGHPGFGGQMIQFDLKHRLAYAYLTNGLGPKLLEDRFIRLEKALYNAI